MSRFHGFFFDILSSYYTRRTLYQSLITVFDCCEFSKPGMTCRSFPQNCSLIYRQRHHLSSSIITSIVTFDRPTQSAHHALTTCAPALRLDTPPPNPSSIHSLRSHESTIHRHTVTARPPLPRPSTPSTLPHLSIQQPSLAAHVPNLPRHHHLLRTRHLQLPESQFANPDRHAL